MSGEEVLLLLISSLESITHNLGKRTDWTALWTADTFQGNSVPTIKKGSATSLQTRLAAMMRKGDKVIARHKRLAEQYVAGLHDMRIPGLPIPSH